MQQQRAFLLLFLITQQLVQIDQGSCVHCDNEDEELPHLYDRGNQETHISQD